MIKVLPSANDSAPLHEEQGEQGGRLPGEQGQRGPAGEQQGAGDRDDQAGPPVGEAAGGRHSGEGARAEQDQSDGDPPGAQPGRAGHDRGEEGEGAEGRRVHQRGEQHHQDQPAPGELGEFRTQARVRDRVRPCPPGRDTQQDAEGGGHAEHGDGEEGGAPAEQGAEHRAAGDTGDRGQRRASQQHGQCPALPGGRHHRRRGGQGDGEEPRVGEGGDDPDDDHDRKAGRHGPDHVRGREGEEEDEQAGPAGPVAGERGHQRGAGHHADGERGGEHARGADGHAEVGGEGRQEAGQHELRGAHGEDRQGEEVERKRHRVLRGEGRYVHGISSPRPGPTGQTCPAEGAAERQGCGTGGQGADGG